MMSGKVSTRTPIGRRLRPRSPYQVATITKTVSDKIRLRRVSRNQPICGLSVLASAIGQGHGQRGDESHSEDGVTRPPGDRPGMSDMVRWRAKGQHHTNHR